MKKFFPSLLNNKNFIFCENAGGSQIPNQVTKQVNKFLENYYIQPGSNNLLSNNLTNDLKEINDITNIILNNKKGKIIYGNSCSQLSFNLANGLKENLCDKNENNLIITDFNHEACVSPFERIFQEKNLNIKRQSLNNFSLNYDNIIEKVDNNTKLVILPHASNILGNILNIKYLNKKIKDKNKTTKILVDGVAYMPHDIIDVDLLDIDYYIVSFYKFCGLRISALYIKDENLIDIKNQNHYFLKLEE
jgi:selenocysteine lyase/cysteine desulfurase